MCIRDSLGIARSDVYITNVVKCRPPKNRDPLPAELEACADYLEQQVAIINPRIIVTLGRFSMKRWFPEGSITRVHGQVRNIGRGRIAVAMFHPAAALRNPQWQTEFEQDMAKLPPLSPEAIARPLTSRIKATPPSPMIVAPAYSPIRLSW